MRSAFVSDLVIITKSHQLAIIDLVSDDPSGQFQSVEENDFYAYRGEGWQKLVLSPGDFIVVFPDDAHKIKMQLGKPAVVTKAVFKVKIH